MNKIFSRQSYQCAQQADPSAYTREEAIQLQNYLFELEGTIVRLTDHIAELERLMNTLLNEQQVQETAERQKNQAPSALNAAQPKAAGSFVTTPEQPVLFKFDPSRKQAWPKTNRSYAPTGTNQSDQQPR